MTDDGYSVSRTRPSTEKWIDNKSMSVTVWSKMKRQGKQLVILSTFISFLLCLVFYSNTAVWNSINTKYIPGDNALSVGGVRKLLEEGEFASEKFPPIGKQKRLPQCIIFGVRKCGTRALLEFVKLHPMIQPAEHEVHFFDDETRYSLGLEWYKEHMPYSFPEQVTIEKSPRYFITEKVPERIFEMNSTIKLIVLLRNPTTRVISDYTQVYYNKIAKGKPFDKFENLVIDEESGEVDTGYKAIRISIYHEHFRRWLRVFKPEQIHVVNGDNLIVNPLQEIQKVEYFLGLNHQVTEKNLYFNETRGFYCMRYSSEEKCLGATKGRKHPDIDPQVLQKLNDFFRPHNEKLFKLMNLKFDWD